MIEIRKTQVFEEWFVALRDRQARLRIQARIDRLMFANPGQHRVLTRGVYEEDRSRPRLSRLFREAWRGMGIVAMRWRQEIVTGRYQGGTGDGG